MADTSKVEAPRARDIAYYRQRQKNKVFTALVEFFARQAERGRISKKELANKLGKDPSQITRWLSAPSNFELDTISDILLAMGAEMDHRIVPCGDRANANYAHPLISPHMGIAKPMVVAISDQRKMSVRISTESSVASTASFEVLHATE